MGELDTTTESNKRYYGFSDTKIAYDDRRVFKSMASGTYYIEREKGGLEIMCTGDVDKMLKESK